jgi:hypothetical protein
MDTRESIATGQQKQDINNTVQSIGGLVSEDTTYDESVLYIKKLIMIGISSIAYLRALMPEKDFADRSFENRKIKVLDKWSTNGEVKKLQQGLNGAFDALDKGYLKSLTLALYENEVCRENVLETYEFNIKYTDAEASLALNKRHGNEKIKMDSLRLLLAIFNIASNLPFAQ